MRIACLFLLILLIPLTCGIILPAEQAHAGIFDKFINMQIEPVGDVIAEVRPSESHYFRFKYYNGGTLTKGYNFYTEFTVDVEGEGWIAYVSPTSRFTGPNETADGHVMVAASARPSNTASIHVSGRFRDIYGNWYYGNYTFQVKVAQYHSFDVKVNKTFIHGRQERIYSVPVTIVNYGNREDRFTISTKHRPPGWNVGISQSPIILPPRGEATFYVYFTTPHERVYTQATTHFIMLEVISEGTSYKKPVSIVVTVEGFHLTLGQLVAFLSGAPSLILLAFLAAAMHMKNSPYSYVPKPWKEEREELEKLQPPQRKRVLKEMKEEWESSKQFLRWALLSEQKHARITRRRNAKQRSLEERIQTEWKRAWIPVHEAWKEECSRLRKEYEKLEKQLAEKIGKAKVYGIKVDASLPKPVYPPEPKKPPLPKVPEYRVDERRNVLIEPDEVEIERILMPLKRYRMLTKREIAKIREMSDEMLARLNQSFNSMETKIEAEIKRRKLREKQTRTK